MVKPKACPVCGGDVEAENVTDTVRVWLCAACGWKSMPELRFARVDEHQAGSLLLPIPGVGCGR
jgi:hypothetical protein